MQKIVINDYYGGFGLSDAARKRYVEIKGGDLPRYEDPERDDPVLIQVVEELGDAASGRYSSLKIVEIPDDIKWQIEEYDGMEHVAEEHRTWS